MAAKTVDEYLAALPPAQRAALKKLRATIRAAAPNATEKISWRVPCYMQNGMLVSFAAFKDHCSFMPMNPAVVDAFATQVAPYRTGKVVLRFTPEKPLPVTLVRKLVKACIIFNETKTKRKTQKQRVSRSSL